MFSQITPPTRLTLLISLALVIIAVVARAMAYTDMQVPIFPTGGFVLLLIGYVVLLAGNLFDGM